MIAMGGVKSHVCKLCGHDARWHARDCKARGNRQTLRRIKQDMVLLAVQRKAVQERCHTKV